MELAWCDCECAETPWRTFWEAPGILKQGTEYVQEWIEVNDLIGGVRLGEPGRIYEIYGTELYGYTHGPGLMQRAELNSEGMIYAPGIVVPAQAVVWTCAPWLYDVLLQRCIDRAYADPYFGPYIGEVACIYKWRLACGDLQQD
jgi:hypothetical protein